jgi:hypothetical protein
MDSAAGAEEKKHFCIHDVGVKRARLLTRNSMSYGDERLIDSVVEE